MEVTRSDIIAEAATQNEAALPQFEEILDMAIAVCLRGRSSYEEHLQAVRTEKLQSTKEPYSPWASRATMEMQYNEYEYVHLLEDYGVTYSAIRNDVFSFIPAADPEVQSKIEAFGRALLDDAFISLGPEAPMMVESYKNGSYEDQRKIIIWLEGVISSSNVELQEESAENEEFISELRAAVEEGCQRYDALFVEEETGTDTTIRISDLPRIITREIPPEEAARMRASLENSQPLVVSLDVVADVSQTPFNPIRLSPKILGVYPNFEIEPTCLARSILVASFFEKTGQPYVHAGVVRTATEISRLWQYATMKSIKDFVESRGDIMPPLLDEVFKEVKDSYKEIGASNNGFHAVVLARLSNGSWVLSDYNYQKLIEHNPESSLELDEKYLHLFEAATNSPGVEVTSVESDIFDIEDVVYYSVLGLKNAPSDQQLIELLNSTPEDELVEALKIYILTELCQYYEEIESTISEQYDFYLDDMFRGKRPEAKIDYIDKVLEYILNKYVLGSPKAKEDYVEMAKMLRLAPALVELCMLADITISFVDYPRKTPYSHAVMELGMPGYRIGACVLSDFDLFTGNRLPFSFWASNWTSYVTYGNHTPDFDDEIQSKIAERLINSTDVETLSYMTTRGIIHGFLEQRENRNGKSQSNQVG